MDAQKKARASELMKELAELLASAENSDGSFKTFDQMELAANAIGDQVTTMLTQKCLEKALASKSHTHRCPKCNRVGDPLEEPDPRVLQTSRGEVQWNEDEYFCRKCRKAFFPSDRTTGIKS
jgi:uncharacterized protein with PIN domain